MISLIESFDETIIRFDVSPQHVVIVSIYLEERLEFVYVMLERENSLEMAHPIQLLLRFK